MHVMLPFAPFPAVDAVYVTVPVTPFIASLPVIPRAYGSLFVVLFQSTAR